MRIKHKFLTIRLAFCVAVIGMLLFISEPQSVSAQTDGFCGSACTSKADCSGGKDSSCKDCIFCSVGKVCTSVACGLSCTSNGDCAGGDGECSICSPEGICSPSTCGLPCTNKGNCTGGNEACGFCSADSKCTNSACGLSCSSNGDCAGGDGQCDSCEGGKCVEPTCSLARPKLCVNPCIAGHQPSCDILCQAIGKFCTDPTSSAATSSAAPDPEPDFVVDGLKVYGKGCGLTYAEAQAACAAEGMRLPTKSEVPNVTSTGKGCCSKKFNCAIDAWYQGGDTCTKNCNYCTCYKKYYDWVYYSKNNVGVYCVK